MFKNLFKNKFAISKKDIPLFFAKIPFSPIATSSKIIQIFKSLRVARVVLCQVEKVSSGYFAKRLQYALFCSLGNMT